MVVNEASKDFYIDVRNDLPVPGEERAARRARYGAARLTFSIEPADDELLVRLNCTGLCELMLPNYGPKD